MTDRTIAHYYFGRSLATDRAPAILNSDFGFGPQMTLDVRAKLEPYEILCCLGAGGMGEVEPLGLRKPVLSEAEGSRPAKSRAHRGIKC